MSRYDDLLARINACGVAPGLGSIGQNYQMEQSPSELATFLDRCLELDVTSMLELGTGEYGGFQRFCVVHLDWSVASIDHRTPLFQYGYFILGETNDPTVIAQVRDHHFDLVLIDADHHYESVQHDYEVYAPLAMKVVALHDVAPNREGTQGVSMFWRELQTQNPSLRFREIIDSQHPVGIGWIEL